MTKIKHRKSVFFNETGVALFLVLWVLTLLSVIVGEFCYTMRTEINITRNFKEETQAYYIAQAGINMAIAELIKNQVTPPKIKSPDEEIKEDKIEWRINADIPAIPFANGKFKVKIGNESGKININKADPPVLRMMLEQFQLLDTDRDGIVDSILDWRDSDSLHRVNGAEDDYYLGLPEPYECKDADFDSLEELRLVKGITPEIYEVLKHIVTVWEDEESKEQKTATDKAKKGFDFNKIDLNAASWEILRSLPQMTDELTDEILKYRKEKEEKEKKSFESLGELISIIGSDIYTAIMPYLSLQTSPIYTIKSVGSVEDSTTTQEIQVVVKIDTTIEKKYRIIQWFDTVIN